MRIVLGILFCLGYQVLIAQPRSVRDEVKSIKSDPTFVWVERESGDAASSRNYALLDLGHQIIRKYGSIFTADGLINDAPKSALLNPQYIEWERRGTHTAIAYVDKNEASRYYERCIRELFTPTADRFKYGVAKGDSREEAMNAAKIAMLNSIQQVVDARQSYSITESGGNVDEVFESQLKSFSKMTLIGSETQVVEFGPNDFIAYTYISPDNLEKSFEQPRTRIIALAKEGERSQKRGDIISAIRAFYKGYIQSSLYFRTIPYDFEDGVHTENLEQALRERVEFLILNADVEVNPAFEKGDGNVQADFMISFQKKPLSGLFYQYESNIGTNIEPVVNGRGSVALTDLWIKSLQLPYKIKFLVDITDDIMKDEELALLAPAKSFAVEKDVIIDLTKAVIIKVDGFFSSNLTANFELSTRNMMVEGVRWEFGDGNADFSTDKIIHNYEKPGVYTVNVIINGSEELTQVVYADTKNGTISKTRPSSVPKTFSRKDSKVFSDTELKQILSGALAARSTIKLQSEIKRLRDQGRITYGRPEQMRNRDNVVVFTADRSLVKGCFKPDGNGYQNLSEGGTTSDLDKENAPLQVWIQILK